MRDIAIAIVSLLVLLSCDKNAGAPMYVNAPAFCAHLADAGCPFQENCEMSIGAFLEEQSERGCLEQANEYLRCQWIDVPQTAQEELSQYGDCTSSGQCDPEYDNICACNNGWLACTTGVEE